MPRLYESCRRLGLGLDDDLSTDDVRLERVQLRLQFCGDLRVELVEWRQAGAVVFEGANVRLIGERAILGRPDRVRDSDVHALIDTGDDVGAIRLRTYAAVGVHPDRIDFAATAFGGLQCAKAGWSSNGEHDVRALADQALSRTLTTLLVLEVTSELPILLGCIPSKDLDVGALLLVVVVHTLAETVHEDRDSRDLGAAERADLLGLSHARSQVASEEAGLGGVEDQRLEVLDSRV